MTELFSKLFELIPTFPSVLIQNITDYAHCFEGTFVGKLINDPLPDDEKISLIRSINGYDNKIIFYSPYLMILIVNQKGEVVSYHKNADYKIICKDNLRSISVHGGFLYALSERCEVIIYNLENKKIVHTFDAVYGSNIEFYESLIYLVDSGHMQSFQSFTLNGPHLGRMRSIQSFTLNGTKGKLYTFDKSIWCFKLMDNNMYVCHRDEFVCYSLDGKLKYQWNLKELGELRPRHMIINGGFIYLSYMRGVQQYDFNGTLLKHFKYEPKNNDENVSFGQFVILNGYLYIANNGEIIMVK